MTTNGRSIITQWSGSTGPYPRDWTLATLFEDEAERAPGASAVLASGCRLTYEELNRQANQLAHHLRARGVKPEDRVGVLLERSPDVVVALLAIVKAGAAYVPLDPSYPRARVASLIEDSLARVVVTRAALARDKSLAAELAVCIDRDAVAIATETPDNLPLEIDATSLAYALFTSGSTGPPKEVGVPIGRS